MPPFVPFPFYLFMRDREITLHRQPITKTQLVIVGLFALWLMFLLGYGIETDRRLKRELKEKEEQIMKETQQRMDSIRAVYSDQRGA